MEFIVNRVDISNFCISIRNELGYDVARTHMTYGELVALRNDLSSMIDSVSKERIQLAKEGKV